MPRLLALSLTAVLALAACQSSDDAPAATAGVSDPVDPADLEALLPDSVRVLSRTSSSSVEEGAEGFTVARATGRYDLANPTATTPTVALVIVDFGSREMARSLDYDWVETPDGDTLAASGVRTTLLDGYPSRYREKADLDNKTVSVMVGGRFLVEAKGDFVDREVLENAVRAVGLARVAALGDGA